MLDELEVLVLEVLAGSLETVNLLDLALLLCESLTDDLAGLGIGLVANALGVLLGLGNDGIRGLLRSDKGRGDLALGSGVIRRGNGCGSRRGGSLGLGELRLGLGELLLGSGQAVLEIHDLVEHSVDLRGNLLKEDVDLGGIIAALSLRKSLGLNICRGDSHRKILSVPLMPQRTAATMHSYKIIPIKYTKIRSMKVNARTAITGEKSIPPMGGMILLKKLRYGPTMPSSTAPMSASNPLGFMGIHASRQ